MAKRPAKATPKQQRPTTAATMAVERSAPTIDPEAARRLASEWRRFGETMTAAAHQAEWRHPDGERFMPAPWHDLAESRILHRADSLIEGGKAATRIIAPPAASAEARGQAAARLSALAERSLAAVGLPVRHGRAVGDWAGRVFDFAAAKRWNFGGRSGSTLVGGSFRRDSDPARFGEIADFAAASADELERVAAGAPMPGLTPDHRAVLEVWRGRETDRLPVLAVAECGTIRNRETVGRLMRDMAGWRILDWPPNSRKGATLTERGRTILGDTNRR